MRQLLSNTRTRGALQMAIAAGAALAVTSAANATVVPQYWDLGENGVHHTDVPGLNERVGSVQPGSFDNGQPHVTVTGATFLYADSLGGQATTPPMLNGQPTDTLELGLDAGDQRFTMGLMADFPQLGGGNKSDFILQTRVTSDLGGVNSAVFFGFYALSSAQAYDDVRNGDSGYAAYYARNSSSGGVDMEIRSGGHFGTNITGSNFNATANNWYDLTLTGTYDENGDLTLEFTVLNLDTNQSNTISTGPIENPLEGTGFGIFARYGTATGAKVHFDYFNVIPEPASLALLGVGGLLMLRRRG